MSVLKHQEVCPRAPCWAQSTPFHGELLRSKTVAPSSLTVPLQTTTQQRANVSEGLNCPKLSQRQDQNLRSLTSALYPTNSDDVFVSITLRLALSPNTQKFFLVRRCWDASSEPCNLEERTQKTRICLYIFHPLKSGTLSHSCSLLKVDLSVSGSRPQWQPAHSKDLEAAFYAVQMTRVMRTNVEASAVPLGDEPSRENLWCGSRPSCSRPLQVLIHEIVSPVHLWALALRPNPTVAKLQPLGDQ